MNDGLNDLKVVIEKPFVFCFVRFDNPAPYLDPLLETILVVLDVEDEVEADESLHYSDNYKT